MRTACGVMMLFGELTSLAIWFARVVGCPAAQELRHSCNCLERLPLSQHDPFFVFHLKIT